MYSLLECFLPRRKQNYSSKFLTRYCSQISSIELNRRIGVVLHFVLFFFWTESGNTNPYLSKKKKDRMCFMQHQEVHHIRK
jgi:hypothetical protein